jgi:FAD-linked sulfhydryl oxidase
MAEEDCADPVCEKDDPITTMRRLVNKRRRDMFEDEEGLQCPLGKATLGFFTWNLLHTMAIYYHDQPSPTQKESMRHFIDGLAEFYPCKTCRGHFQVDVRKSTIFAITYRSPASGLT